LLQQRESNKVERLGRVGTVRNENNHFDTLTASMLQQSLGVVRRERVHEYDDPPDVTRLFAAFSDGGDENLTLTSRALKRPQTSPFAIQSSRLNAQIDNHPDPRVSR
jgi:hypothetical protein